MMIKNGRRTAQQGWGTMMGPIPHEIKARALRGDRTMNNLPLDIVHNHDRGKGDVRYLGYSKTATQYHLFQCVALGRAPKRGVRLVDFDVRKFPPGTKAGGGGCSHHQCPGDAVKMNRTGTKAYCERCILLVTGKLPCSWSSILPCNGKMGNSKPCPTCNQFEKRP